MRGELQLVYPRHVPVNVPRSELQEEIASLPYAHEFMASRSYASRLVRMQLLGEPPERLLYFRLSRSVVQPQYS